MLQQAIKQVLDLQLSYRFLDAPEMRERGEVLRSIAEELRGQLRGPDLKVQFSNGVGNFAKVPWVRIYTEAQAPSAQQGWYIVLLFAADGSRASLSLNQGVTKLTTAEVESATAYATNLLRHSEFELGDHRDSRVVADIDLADPGLGARYERGNVAAFTYPVNDVPDDETIFSDVGWLVERLAVMPSLSEVEASTPAHQDTADLAELANLIHWDEERIQEIFEGLMDESPQVVLTGPPGTGKTWVARHLAAYMLGMTGQVQNNPYIEVVQFHPSYGYEDFVEGLRPVANESGHLEFAPVSGTILRLADDIAKDSLPRVLIIDEMNRANLPKVFGELMFLLEYRDQDVRLVHRERFSLPRNLYIIGTMNTADRNARNIDLALRRRFDFYELPASGDVLRRHYSTRANDLGVQLFDGFEALNRSIEERMGDRHLQVGHSYLMRDEMNRVELERIWKHQIGPLLEDYFFDRPSLLEGLSVDEFWPR